ncbi:MAG: ATP-binding protein [Thermodesulfobacteriota bacterium]
MDAQILLVEDSLTQAKQCQHDLETAGLRTELARNGKEALAMLRSFIPRLIISDIKMPEMDGFELCRAVKQQERLRDVPFVLLTSFTEPQDVLHSLAAGADGFISKGTSKADMLAGITHWLNRKETAASQPARKYVRFDYQGLTYRIPADTAHILDFLVHTYWLAIRHNYVLENTRYELDQANQELEQRLHDLAVSESRFHSLVRTIPDIVYQITPEGRFTFINEAVARLGYSPKEIVGRHFEEIIMPLESRPISRDKALAEFTGMLIGEIRPPKLVDERRTGERQTSGLVVELMGRTSRPAPNKVFAEINSAGLYEVHPEMGEKVFLGTVGVMRDITDRRRMEQELHEAYEGLEAKVQDRTQELSQSNAALRKEIADRELAEAERRENEMLLQSILDGIRAAVFFVDPESMVIVDCNPMAETLLSLPREKIVGASGCAFQHRADLHAAGGCRKAEGAILNRDVLMVDGAGHVIPALKTVLPAMLKGREIQVEIVIDMTEHKALERQLAYAQKLESIGQLAAGIAHEINTPIQYLGGNLEFLRRSFEVVQTLLAEYANLLEAARGHPELAAAVGRVEEVERATHARRNLSEVSGAFADSEDGLTRVSSIVMAMKKFSHPDVEEKKPVDINEAIRNTVTIARNEWKYFAEISLDLDPDLPVATLIPGDFNQIMLNLVVNAAHAVGDKVGRSGEKGTIAISTRQDGEFVEVRVCDSGIGIPEENRHKIFNPFFTTKPQGKGTGQGLAITHAIVEKHAGSIDFESVVGQGTTFILRLPFGGPAHEAE